jgi:hypothetical protein
MNRRQFSRRESIKVAAGAGLVDEVFHPSTLERQVLKTRLASVVNKNAGGDQRGKMAGKLQVAVFGAGIGFLGAVGIYFAPDEPYPGHITAAGTLNGILVALLISSVVSSGSSIRQSIGWGIIMGALASATVFLAKGGWTSWDAPFVVPTGIVTGAILGPLVRWRCRKTT